MMIITLFVLGLAIMLSESAASTEYTKPQCLQPMLKNIYQQQVVCRDVQNMKDLNEIVQKDWKHLKIVNGDKEQFHIDDETGGKFLYVEDLDLSESGELLLEHNGFKDFSNLIALNISGCQLEALKATHFDIYNKLQHLDASWNQLQELSFDLKTRILHLETANFSHNSIRFIENDTWRIFQKLKRLYLDNNELKTVQLHNYPELEIISLSDNQIEQITTKSFDFLSSMEELVITSNPLYHIEDRAFESMLNLRTLNLSANSLEQLTVEVFAGLGRLIQLDLSSNDLREVSNLQFQYLIKLQYLDISRNSLTTLNSTNFNSLSNLRKLYIYENDIKEVKSNTFANLISLDTLDLSYNSIEYLESDVFGSFTLPRLKKLLLKSNNLKHLHPLAFTSLPYMQYLSLGNNELTTLDVRMFAPMRRLEKLHLGTNLFETIPSEVLDTFTDITELLIDNNRLTFLSDTNSTFDKLQKVSIEGNPWQCPCLNEMTKWLQARHVSYVRTHSPFYKGKKPLCVVTPVDVCVKNLKLVKEHGIEDIYNQGS